MIAGGSEYAYNITVSLYGDYLACGKWPQDFLRFAESVQGRLNLRFTDFGCAYFEEGKKEPTLKSLKYLKRNMEKIRSLAARDDIFSMDFVTAEKGVDLTRDAKCSIGLSRPHPALHVHKPYYHFYFQAVPEVLSLVIGQDGVLTFFVSLLREVESLINIRYGLVQPMASEKRAGIYFSDIFTGSLSQVERQNLHMWLRSNHEYHCKVRSVYWGNMLTCEHLGTHATSILAEIKRIVGEKNLVELVEGKYLIVIPTDPLELPVTRGKMESFVGKVESILSKYNLLMT